MSSKLCLAIEKHPHGFPGDEWLSFLVAHGVAAAHPVAGGATLLDDAGECVPCALEDLSRRLNAGQETSFLLWLGCAEWSAGLRPLEGAFGLLYDVTLLARADRQAVASLALTRFRKCAERGTAILYIYDDAGATLDFDWYQFALNDRSPWPDMLPNLLALPSARAASLHAKIGAEGLESFRGYSILRGGSRPSGP